MWKEIRYALRLLGKTPGFSALTVFVLAAGLGTTIYMFVLLRTLAYADLPYPDQERIVVVAAVSHGIEQTGNSVSWFDFEAIKAEQTAFEQLAMIRRSDGMLSGALHPTRIRAYAYSSAEIFQLADIPALHGRTLQAADYTTDAGRVMVLSWSLWQSQFNADPNIVGKTIKFDDDLTTVVGVMPRDYSFPDVAEAWIPLKRSGAVKPGDGPYGRLLGKLKPGRDIGQADAEVKAITKQLEQQFPATNSQDSAKVWPLTQQEMSNSMAILALMAGAAAVILVLVVLNAGNLLLARAAERQKEIAIRSALGAPRHRVMREMLWEATLLTFAGGMIGLFMASWAMQWSLALFSRISDALPFWWRFEFDATTLLAALLLTLLVAISVGVYPAWRASAGDLNRFLRDGTRGARGLQQTRMNHVLVVVEISLSVSLLIAALTLVSSVRNSMQADYGVRRDSVLTAEIELYTAQYNKPERLVQFSQQLEAVLLKEPGIERFAMSCHLPGNFGPIWTYQVEGTDVPDQNYPTASRIIVSDGFFALYEIGLKTGRLFDGRDRLDSEPVVVISQTFAERNWPGQSPIGKRIDLDRSHAEDSRQWYTVIGVVSDVVYGSPNPAIASLPALYLTYRQLPDEDMRLSIRTRTDPMAMARPVSTHVRKLDEDLPVLQLMPLIERHQRDMSGLQFVADLFLAFGALGVLLAGSGMYGVIARAVTLRTQELGIRRALGASEDRVLLMLMKQGGWRFLLGGSIGLLLGLLMTQVVASILYDVENTIPVIAAGVLLLIAALVATATLLPARQAVNLSPAAALRYE